MKSITIDEHATTKIQNESYILVKEYIKQGELWSRVDKHSLIYTFYLISSRLSFYAVSKQNYTSLYK